MKSITYFRFVAALGTAIFLSTCDRVAFVTVEDSVGTRTPFPSEPLAVPMDDEVLKDRVISALPFDQNDLELPIDIIDSTMADQYLDRLLKAADNTQATRIREAFQALYSLAAIKPESFWELIIWRANNNRMTRGDSLLYNMALVAIIDHGVAIASAISTEELFEICDTGNGFYSILALDVLRSKVSRDVEQKEFDQILRLIEESDGPVRLKAISVLGRIGGPRTQNIVESMLTRPTLPSDVSTRLHGVLDEIAAAQRFEGVDLGP